MTILEDNRHRIVRVEVVEAEDPSVECEGDRHREENLGHARRGDEEAAGLVAEPAVDERHAERSEGHVSEQDIPARKFSARSGGGAQNGPYKSSRPVKLHEISRTSVFLQFGAVRKVVCLIDYENFSLNSGKTYFRSKYFIAKIGVDTA